MNKKKSYGQDTKEFQQAEMEEEKFKQEVDNTTPRENIDKLQKELPF